MLLQKLKNTLALACFPMVKKNGCALAHIPEWLRTRELCMEAVKSDAWAIEYIPDNVLDENMCLMAVSQVSDLLDGYIPEDRRTKNVCLAAIRRNAWLWDCVPDNIRGGAKTAGEFVQRSV